MLKAKLLEENYAAYVEYPGDEGMQNKNSPTLSLFWNYTLLSETE